MRISNHEVYIYVSQVPLYFSIARCARKVITKTSSCCVMAATKAVTLTVTNPRSLLFPRETGTAQLVYPRYLKVFNQRFPFFNCFTFRENGFIEQTITEA